MASEKNTAELVAERRKLLPPTPTERVPRSGPTQITREIIDDFCEQMKKLEGNNRRQSDMNIANVSIKCENATVAAAETSGTMG
jgi:hypothetical protein